MNRAKEWALRCRLELQQHQVATFATLTYEEPPDMLSRRELQRFLKRFRKAMGPERTIRFFACGEYGEKNGRPHYHAILFGCDPVADRKTIEKAWPFGHVKSLPVTVGAIHYVAGYTQKKAGERGERPRMVDVIDQETGEVLGQRKWQPPFIQMSRRPGIGGEARKHTASWKEYAVLNGQKMSVPRFYHEAWKATATEQEIEQTALQRKLRAQEQKTTLQMLAAQEIKYQKAQELSAARRVKA